MTELEPTPFSARRTALSIAAVATVITVCLAARDARAQANQITLTAPQLGYAPSLGVAGGHAGVIGATMRWNFTPVVGLWSTLQYALGAGDPLYSLRHTGGLAVGVSFSIDLLRVIPWAGLGLRASVVGTPNWVGFVPSAELRLGVDVPFTRYVGLSIQLAYSLPFANRAFVEHMFEASIGPRFAFDL